MLDPPPKTIGLLLECLFKKLIISSSFLAILKSFETPILIPPQKGIDNWVNEYGFLFWKDVVPCPSVPNSWRAYHCPSDASALGL